MYVIWTLSPTFFSPIKEPKLVFFETSIPSILVELGFIDNPEERNKIKTNEYQERLANGIVDGIVEYYK